MPGDQDRAGQRKRAGGFDPFGKDGWSWFLLVPIALTGGLLLIPLFFFWYFTSSGKDGTGSR